MSEPGRAAAPTLPNFWVFNPAYATKGIFGHPTRDIIAWRNDQFWGPRSSQSEARRSAKV
jgi:hypothetical protein